MTVVEEQSRSWEDSSRLGSFVSDLPFMGSKFYCMFPRAGL